MDTHALGGVLVAAVTPLKPNDAIDVAAIPPLLHFFAGRGCHGALLFGTTGEGPSFAPQERIEAARAAVIIKQTHPEFKLLLGVGTPSLQETVDLTRATFDLGFDGVLSLPPYFFRKAGDEGLFAWYADVIKRGVPGDGAFFAYHIPPVSGVAVSPDLLASLKDAFPRQFAGVKDSSADSEYGLMLAHRFGRDLIIYCGTDPFLQGALSHGAGGAITAPANLFSPELRAIWDAHRNGAAAENVQKRIAMYREILDRYLPAAGTLKALLARRHGQPRWAVRPPLLPISPEAEEDVVNELQAAGLF